MSNTEPYIKIYCDTCGGQTIRLNMSNNDGTSSCRHPTCICDTPQETEPDIYLSRYLAQKNSIIVITPESIQADIDKKYRQKSGTLKRIQSWLRNLFVK